MAAYADLPPSPPAFGTAFAVRTAVDGYQALGSDARKRDAKGKGMAEEEEEVDIVEGEESGLEQQPLANLVRFPSSLPPNLIDHLRFLTIRVVCFRLSDLHETSSLGGDAAHRVGSVGVLSFGPL